jgi:steroid delta-isomerase-like uncharacterized protein
MAETNVPTIDAIIGALNAHDAAQMSRQYKEGARVWMVGIRGEKNIGGFDTHARLLAAMPDSQLSVVAAATSGDTTIVEWTRQGTHTGQFEQLAPTNNVVSLRGVSVYQLEGGKVAEERIYVDSQDLYGQLAVPRKRSSAVATE